MYGLIVLHLHVVFEEVGGAELLLALRAFVLLPYGLPSLEGGRLLTKLHEVQVMVRTVLPELDLVLLENRKDLLIDAVKSHS